MSKPFADLTDAEKCALTDEQIQWYMDKECAESGVPLLPQYPGPEPEPFSPVHDVTLYDVGGILFKSAEDAEKCLRLIAPLERASLGYARGGNYNQRVVEAAPDLAINPKQGFSLGYWDSVKSRAAAANGARSDHDSALAAYNKAADERGKAVAWIADSLSEARSREYDRNALRDALTRYLELASGDRGVALRFLHNAYASRMGDLLKEDEFALLPMTAGAQ